MLHILVDQKHVILVDKFLKKTIVVKKQISWFNMRYIPPLILNNCEMSVYSDSFTGFVLFFDIADFTPLVAKLHNDWKMGAEQLNYMLKSAFSAPLEMIISHGGFITGFGGDSFTAVVAEPESGKVISLLGMLGKHLAAKAIEPLSDEAKHSVSIRVGISYGEINWKILPGAIQNDYIFFGEAFDDLRYLHGNINEISYSNKATIALEMLKTEANESAYSPQQYEQAILKYQNNSTVYQRFINPKYVDLPFANEFREGCFCFVDLTRIAEKEENEAVNTIYDLAERYGGFVNKIESSDKGFVVLILFGIPLQEENTVKRALLFSTDLVKTIATVAIGVACGSVYAGFTGNDEIREFTALGLAVNLAARLMNKAKAAEVLVDELVYSQLSDFFNMHLLGTIILKGFDNPVKYYLVAEAVAEVKTLRVHTFVGRITELEYLENLIQTGMQDKSSAVIYVSGEAGIGKTRISEEVLKNYENSGAQVIKITCEEINTPAMDAIRKIIRNAFYYNSQLPSEVGKNMFAGLWTAFADKDKDLKRMEPVIGSLLDYSWENSFWENLPNREKSFVLEKAFSMFMAKLCSAKPLIIFLDDGQWLDGDSLHYLQILKTAEYANPLFIISSCRYTKSGEKVDFQLDELSRFDLELRDIDDSSDRELICSILRLKSIPDATYDFIRQKAMGNPLFTEQISSYLIEKNCLSHTGELSSIPENISSFKINEIISSRLDLLSNDLRETILYASVLGMEFDLNVLSEMLQHDLREPLDIGERFNIWKNLDEIHYIFTHILIKDTAYHRMMHSKLIHLHKIAAESYLTLYKDDMPKVVLELAYHLENSGQAERAVEELLKVADRLSYSCTHQCISKAIDVSHRCNTLSIDLKADLFDWYGSILIYSGKIQAGIGEKTKALALIENNLDSDERVNTAVSLLVELGYHSYKTIDNSISMGFLNRAIALVNQNKESISLGNLRHLSAVLETGDKDNSIKMLVLLHQLATQREDNYYVFLSLTELIIAKHFDDIEKPLKDLTRLKSNIETDTAVSEEKKLSLIFLFAYFYQKIGKLPKALATYQELDKAIADCTKPYRAQYYVGLRDEVASCYIELKEYEEAIRYLYEACNFIEGDDTQRQLYSYFKSLLADCYLKLGNYQMAKDCIEECLRYSSEEDLHQVISNSTVAAETYYALHEYDKAKTHFLKLSQFHEEGYEVEDIESIKQKLAEIEVM